MKGMRRTKKVMLALVTAGMMLSFAACGASSAESMAMDAGSAPMESVESMSYNGLNYAVMEEAGAEYKMEDSATGSSESSVDVVETNRKLIKTVDMNVETQSFDELLSTIEDRVKELGGYIESMDTYNGSSFSSYRSTRNAEMTLRIPKDKLDSFLSTVSDVSNVVRRSDSVEDVTLAYVDLESHKEALETEQTRLLELLEKAESIEDIITIEERLSNVRYQLESMESRLRTYDNQVDYSTVYLYVEEVEIYTPVDEESVGERISEGFTESLDNIGEGFVEFGIWFVVHIPYFIVWGVLIAAFVGFVLWLVKLSSKPSKKSVSTGAQTNLQSNVNQEEKK